MNKKTLVPIIIICLVAFACIVTAVWYSDSSKQPLEQQKVKVVTSIFPLYDIAKNVGGEKISVHSVISAGASPHTFQLKPSDIQKLQDAQAAFMIGHELDSFIEPAISQNSDARIVIVDKNIKLKEYDEDEHNEEYEDGHENEDDHQGTDPHYWLSINNAKIIAKSIADELISIDPENSAYYQSNLAMYQKKLDTLLQEISAILSDENIGKLIVFHDSWAYFAQENNLEIAGVFEPSPGVEPSPQYLKNLYDVAKDNNIPVVFTEPQLSSNTINPFIRDLGLNIYTLDPLGGQDNRDSYENLMRYNAQTIKDAYTK